MDENTKFYSLEDIAELLGVTYQLVYKLVRSGELGAIRVGKMYRVTGDDLKAYLGRQRKAVERDVAAVTCSFCGKSYYSSQSIAGACKVCGLPICRNCVDLKGARYCESHLAAGGEAAAEPEEKT